MQVLVACFSNLVWTFFKHFLCDVSGFLLFSVFFFKVNSGVFLHNRVATLAGTTVGVECHVEVGDC